MCTPRLRDLPCVQTQISVLNQIIRIRRGQSENLGFVTSPHGSA